MPPSLPGTYVLLLSLPAAASITVGVLGTHRFPGGYYAYVGSALGPGGLAARIRRHLTPTARPHWHIDALRAHSQPVAVWYATGEERCECTWAAALSRLDGASIPARGFGSSDCSCAGHLLHFASRPRPTALARACGEGVLRETLD